jgi:hypothetical protein
LLLKTTKSRATHVARDGAIALKVNRTSKLSSYDSALSLGKHKSVKCVTFVQGNYLEGLRDHR